MADPRSDAGGPPADAKGLLADARGLLADAITLRRDLHRHPELGVELPRTQQAVMEILDGLDLQVTVGRQISSIVAVLDGDRPGPTTLLRGDMDALPLTEETGEPFTSAVPGVMHACGHDAHTAMLVGAARLLAGRRRQLTGRVVFMFQPGEEGFAGARIMLDDGLAELVGPVARAFAIHVTPLMPSGMVGGRPGALMASADSFEVVVTGRGGHASMPHDTVDPVPVACEIVTALQTMVTRRVPAFDPAVITVGSITAGSTDNVIPENATLLLTVRSVSETSRTLVLDGLRRVIEHVAAAHLCTAQLQARQVGYPVTVNDPVAAKHALAVAADLFGPDQVLTLATPVMGAEDWSFVLREMPGSMMFLGVGAPGVANPAPNHSNRMVIHEPAMAAGIALHAAIALSR